MSHCESTAAKHLRVDKAISVAAVLKRLKDSEKGKSQEEESSPLVSNLTHILHNLLTAIEQESEAINSTKSSEKLSEYLLNSTQDQFSPTLEELENSFQSKSSVSIVTQILHDLLNEIEQVKEFPSSQNLFIASSPTFKNFSEDFQDLESISSINGESFSSEKDSFISEVPPWSPQHSPRYDPPWLPQLCPQLQSCELLEINSTETFEETTMADATKKKIRRLKAATETKLDCFTVEDIHEESIDSYKDDQARLLESLEELSMELADAEDILDEDDLKPLQDAYKILRDKVKVRKKEIALAAIEVRKRMTVAAPVRRNVAEFGSSESLVSSVSSSTREQRALKKTEAK